MSRESVAEFAGRVESIACGRQGNCDAVVASVAGAMSECARAGWSVDGICGVLEAFSRLVPGQSSPGLAELGGYCHVLNTGGASASEASGLAAPQVSVKFCESASDGVNKSSAAGGASAAVPGRWAASNRRKKLNRKNRGVPEWRRNAVPVGFCETVASGSSVNSSCPSYGQALSDAERDAKESLARRRAAENALKEKLAKLKLAELEDKKRCAELADLKHQRIIQWTNEATAKSQQSLDKVKSIDPSSSASQYEIRQQAKKLADSEAEVRRISSIVKTLSPDWQELLERKAESTFNTEYIDELMAKGEAGLDNGFRY